jgi:TolA-binding protein
MMTRWPAIVVAMLALSGCATTWSRPATSDAEFNLDSRVCQHMNTQLVVLSSIPVGEYVGRSGYQRCMLEEGYTEGGAWKSDSGWREE